jgi:hypothetical protein
MRAAVMVFLAVMLSAESGPTPTTASPHDQLCGSIPRHPADAMTGSGFASSIRDLAGRSREEAILAELGRGNLPSFLRELKPVRLSSAGRHGKAHEAIIFVMPDYLAVGSNEDFLRVPLGLDAAKLVARQYGFTLPTRKMVDAIFRQSSLRLAPQPMTPGPRMTSTAYFMVHQRKIEAQRAGYPLGGLVAGHKKDLILTKRLLTRRGRVAIYGWHRRHGEPIQPLSTVHGARYADYSHGVRLVSTTVILDGIRRSVYDVLRDPELAFVLTYEGTIRGAARIMGYGSTEPTRRTRAAPARQPRVS